MTEARKNTTSGITPTGRAIWPRLFKPKPNDEGKLKYELTLVFDKAAQETPEFKAMVAAAKAAKFEEWGDKNVPNLRSPFRKAEEKEDRDRYPLGSVFVCMRSDEPPGVVNERLEKVIDAYKVYEGCYGRASYRAYAYEVKGNKGISLGLNHFQFVKDGVALSGRGRPEDAFTPIDGSNVDDERDNEIPF